MYRELELNASQSEGIRTNAVECSKLCLRYSLSANLGVVFFLFSTSLGTNNEVITS